MAREEHSVANSASQGILTPSMWGLLYIENQAQIQGPFTHVLVSGSIADIF